MTKLYFNGPTSQVFISRFHLSQGGNDPQTEADRKAQRCIVASLTKKFPEISVQGEEVNIIVTLRPYRRLGLLSACAYNSVR